ncbi:hypothetical protein Leryth_001828 [Lithospermum erythrorhizon]|nr:hypothetical protein Leryth_001828 [Lithospermum erythrorhizon]
MPLLLRLNIYNSFVVFFFFLLVFLIMATTTMLLIAGLVLLFSLNNVHADLVEHTLVIKPPTPISSSNSDGHVHNKMVSRMCKRQEITVVNDSFPGPTINVHEGDSVAIHVINNSPYDMSIHW